MASVAIYALRDRDETTRYIGKTIRLRNRFKGHSRDHAWLQSMVVLEWTDQEHWVERERWWIAHGKASGWPLVNATPGGDGPGSPLCESHRRNISSALAGRALTLEHKAKISASHIGQPGTRRGAITSQETRARMSASLKTAWQFRMMSLKDRLLAKSIRDETTGCLLWQGSVGANGYCSIKVRTKDRGVVCELVHRLAYRLEYGSDPPPEAPLVRQTCGSKRCIEPAHLQPSTRVAAMELCRQKTRNR